MGRAKRKGNAQVIHLLNREPMHIGLWYICKKKRGEKENSQYQRNSITEFKNVTVTADRLPEGNRFPCMTRS